MAGVVTEEAEFAGRICMFVVFSIFVGGWGEVGLVFGGSAGFVVGGSEGMAAEAMLALFGIGSL